MTPVSVFFSAQIPIADFQRPLCQQLHVETDFQTNFAEKQEGRDDSHRPALLLISGLLL